MKRTLYKNGLPWVCTKNAKGEDKLQVLLKRCKYRVERHLPSALMVDGSSGGGKTTIAVQLAEYIEGRKIQFEEQVANGVEDFKLKLEICKDKGYKVLIFDEAGEANRKSSPSKVNRSITRVFELYRGYDLIVIICLPRFYFFEGDILQLGVIRVLIHMSRKVEASYSDFKIFRVSQMMWIKAWVKKLPNPMDCYKHGRFSGRGHSLDLEEARSRELADYSLKSKRVEMKKTLLGIKDRLSLEQIADHYGKSSRWVRLKIKDLDDVGSIVQFKKKKWYEKAILERIDELED